MVAGMKRVLSVEECSGGKDAVNAVGVPKKKTMKRIASYLSLASGSEPGSD